MIGETLPIASKRSGDSVGVVGTERARVGVDGGRLCARLAPDNERGRAGQALVVLVALALRCHRTTGWPHLLLVNSAPISRTRRWRKQATILTTVLVYSRAVACSSVP